MKREVVVFILKEELNAECIYLDNCNALKSGKYLLKKENDNWVVFECNEENKLREIASFKDENEANNFFVDAVKKDKVNMDLNIALEKKQLLLKEYIANVPEEHKELFKEYYDDYFRIFYFDLLSKYYGTKSFNEVLSRIEDKEKRIVLSSYEDKLKNVQIWNKNIEERVFFELNELVYKLAIDYYKTHKLSNIIFEKYNVFCDIREKIEELAISDIRIRKELTYLIQDFNFALGRTYLMSFRLADAVRSIERDKENDNFTNDQHKRYISNSSLPIYKKINDTIYFAFFKYDISIDENTNYNLLLPKYWELVDPTNQKIVSYGEFSDLMKTGICIEHESVCISEEEFKQLDYDHYKKCFDELASIIFKNRNLCTDEEIEVILRFWRSFGNAIHEEQLVYYYLLSPEFFEWIGISLEDLPNVKATDVEKEVNSMSTFGGQIDSVGKYGRDKEKCEAYESLEKSEDKELTFDDNESVLKENSLIEKLNFIISGIISLQSAFDESIKYDKYKDELFDKLHKELTQYKNGLMDKVVETMAMDIIRMIDSTKKTIKIYEAKEYSEENYKRLLGLFQGVAEDLQDILYRQSIEAYSVPGDDVDVKQQKIISTLETQDEKLDNKVAERLAEGYEKNGKVLRPERISIYKYKSDKGDS